jgi:hypothetical protein
MELKQSDRNHKFRDLLNKLNPVMYKLLNEPETETNAFNNQLNANIDKNDDFITDITNYINCIITKNKISRADKVLIVDYENVSHITMNIKRSKKGYKLDITGRKHINITNIDVIYYRIATYFILNYAYKNDYKHVFVVCKNKASEGYFRQDYKAIKTKGEIIIGTNNKPEDNAITTFKCNEIQRWLNLGTKCTCLKINNNEDIFSTITSAIKTQEDALLDGRDHDLINLRTDFHKLKGSDDSIVVILYVILTNYARPSIMSEDKHMFHDFNFDQQYIIPFKLNINNLEDSSSEPNHELVINYFSRPFEIPNRIENSIHRLDFKMLLPKYYYGEAEEGIFKNWYKVNDNGKLEIVINSEQPRPDKILSFFYTKYNDKQPFRYDAILRNGKPYLDSFGQIIKLDNNKDIPYVNWDYQKNTYVPALKNISPYKYKGHIETININKSTTKNYCYNDNGIWKPILLKGKPYLNNGKIATIHGNIPYCYLYNRTWYASLFEVPYINISKEEKLRDDLDFDTISPHVWQPYLKKYNVSKSNNFYNKYLKYKVKYTALKNKLNL